MLTIRALHTPAEFEQVVDLEIAIWEMPAREAVPSSMLHAVAHSGGLVAGAFEDDVMVGMAMCFPGQREGRPIVWSHMAGVTPAYQGKDIGRGLKHFQRTWALEQGFTEMRWTFDPLQAGNANFNLHLLGAFTNTYFVNFYGLMNDALNRDMPSDRVEVVWNLRNEGWTAATEYSSLNPQILSVGPDFEPVQDSAARRSESDRLLASIPGMLRNMPPAQRLSWRLALREALLWAFSSHYTAADFIRLNDMSAAYLLTRNASR